MHNPVSAVKNKHRQKAFELLSSRQEISRVDIANELGVSLQTAMKIMQYFTDYGLAEYIGEGSGSLGRKPQMYAFKPNVAHIIAAVHEGNVIRVGILDASYRLLAEEMADIQGDMYDSMVQQPCGIAEQLIKRLKKQGKHADRLLGMGLCLPGVVDDIQNEISFAPNFSLNASYQVGDLVAETAGRIGAPVYIENDANAAVYGEHTNSGTTDLAFISFGTGVGMGMVFDGKLWRGSKCTAGEIGFIPYTDEYSPEQSHYIEELISLDALKRRFGFDRHFGQASMNPEARKAMMNAVSDAAAHLVALTAAMVNISDFVLGGLTVESLGDLLVEEVRRKMKTLSPFPVTVHKQSLACPALIGAARMVMDRCLPKLLSLDT